MTAEAAATPAMVDTARHNPYVGPRSLCADDRIYGRSREIRELRATVVAHRIVLLYAVSGAGKTSLVEAGLRPELEEREFQVFPPIRVGYEPPELGDATGVNRYVLSVMTSLEEARPPEQQLHPSDLVGMELDDYIRRLDGEIPDKDPCLVFDQFEEVFTLDPADWDAKQEFFGELGRVLADRGRWAIFAMREDFIAQLDPYLALIPTHFDTRYRIDLLGPDAAMQAITKPARDGDVEFSLDAAGKIIDDLRRIQVQRGDESVKVQGPSIEPVQLQVVCRRLWASLDPGTARITLDDVAAAGTVDEALADFYDAAVKEAASQRGMRERQIRDWFDHKLITPDGFRTQVRKGPGRSGPEVLHSLQSSHLLRSDRIRGAQWYELSHDRFVEPIRASNAAFRRKRTSRRQTMVAAVAGVILALLAIGAIARFGPQSGAVRKVTLGDSPIEDSIDKPGEPDHYSYDGKEDDNVLIRALGTKAQSEAGSEDADTAPLVPDLALFEGEKRVEPGARFPDDRDEPVILAYRVPMGGGEYRFDVAGVQESTGNYRLELSAGAEELNADETLTGDIGVSRETDLFELHASRNDVMMSVVSHEDLEASVFVFRSDGGLVGREVTVAGRAVRFPLEQAADGRYLIAVTGRGDTTGKYDVGAESTVITEVTIGETVEGAVGEPGEIVVYRFDALPEGYVRLGVEPSDGFNPVVRVSGPATAPVTLNSDYSGVGGTELAVIPTPIGGVYTVFVSGFEASTGAYELGLSPFAEESMVPLGYGEQQAAIIESSSDIAVFRVEAVTGDTLNIVLRPGDELSPVVKVIDPSGVQIGGGFGADGEIVNVTAEVAVNGLHLIQVTGSEGSKGPFQVELAGDSFTSGPGG